MTKKSTRCKYCSEAPHVPTDACLTAAQKVGLIVGQVGLWTIGLLLLIGFVMWLGANF